MKALIISLLNLYVVIIFVYCIFSWFPIPRDGVLADVNSFLGKLCYPVLALFRKFIPSIGGAVDISPIVAFIVLQLLISLIRMI
ncbi:MAG: YggT family protein [Eggerthellaceae bacterium]|nr:YggT family protein [Eggerthellaceae bacterium]